MTDGKDSAFPSTTHGASGHQVNGPEYGVSKREYFAVLILQGIVANSSFSPNADWAPLAVQQANRLIEVLSAATDPKESR